MLGANCCEYDVCVRDVFERESERMVCVCRPKNCDTEESLSLYKRGSFFENILSAVCVCVCVCVFCFVVVSQLILT